MVVLRYHDYAGNAAVVNTALGKPPTPSACQTLRSASPGARGDAPLPDLLHLLLPRKSALVFNIYSHKNLITSRVSDKLLVVE